MLPKLGSAALYFCYLMTRDGYEACTMLGTPLFQPVCEVLALKDVYFPFSEVIP